MLIVDYIVVEDYDTEGLSVSVQQHIKLGWQPFGCLVAKRDVVNGEDGAWFYIQPMVKYAEHNP